MFRPLVVTTLIAARLLVMDGTPTTTPRQVAPGSADGDKPAAAKPGVVREDFEGPLEGGLPKGFRPTCAAEPGNANGKVAKWEVVEDDSVSIGARGRHVLRLSESKNRGAVYNLLLRDEPSPADVTVYVRLRPDRGTEERGGGVVWRAADERNYYLARWNPLEKTVCVYRTVEGRRITLQFVSVVGASGQWHELQVTMKGRVIEVRFDGESVMSLPDDRFRAAGRVGLWTRSDACSSFDNLKIEPAQ